eukprot:546514_1
MAIEPVDRSYMKSLQISVPEFYSQLSRRPGVQVIRLNPLSNSLIVKIAAQSLNVPFVGDIPKRLAEVIIERCLGNPTVCREFVYALRKVKYIKVTTVRCP